MPPAPRHLRLPGAPVGGPADGPDASLYHLTPFPDGSVVLHGGDDGTLYVLPREGEDSVRPVRSFDDPVRHVAVSEDGRRVAVGFGDDFEVRVFPYGGYEVPPPGGEGAAAHPFLAGTGSGGSGGDGFGDDGDDGDDGFGGMMTQDAGDGLASSAAESFSAGPRLDAPIRGLTFLPSGGGDGDGASVRYVLAVATEGRDPTLAFVDVTDDKGGDELLADDVRTAYGGIGGIRSMAAGESSFLHRSVFAFVRFPRRAELAPSLTHDPYRSFTGTN